MFEKCTDGSSHDFEETQAHLHQDDPLGFLIYRKSNIILHHMYHMNFSLATFAINSSAKHEGPNLGSPAVLKKVWECVLVLRSAAGEKDIEPERLNRWGACCVSCGISSPSEVDFFRGVVVAEAAYRHPLFRRKHPACRCGPRATDSVQ